MPLLKKSNGYIKDDLTEHIENQINDSNLKKKYKLPEIKDDNNYAFSVKFPKEHKKILEKHFKDNGIPFSSGVRMLIYEYMRNNNIQ